MASNILKTRIRSKIDYLANWNNNTTFIPLLGEICIAIIPRNISGTSKDPSAEEAYIGYGITDNLGVTGVEGGPRPNVGLTPYAIGVKVGDGNNNFASLPWIQAIAGDVYGWAKNQNPPSASQIGATYGANQTGSVQDAINSIQTSIGGIVSSGISADALSSALNQLQQQLTGSTTEVFNYGDGETDYDNDDSTELPAVNHEHPTKIVRTITQNGLNITTTSSPIEEADLPSISMSKISGLSTSADYNPSTNPLATQDYVNNAISPLITQISGGISFLGVVYESDLLANNSQIIEDGSIVAPIFRVAGSDPVQYRTTPTTSLTAGNIILYRKAITTIDENTNAEVITDADIGKEFIWTGGAWEEFGDEGSFAIKGSITNQDIASNAGIDQSKINGTGNNATLVDDLNAKVDKETGKGLSTNDYTTTEKTKLAGIEAGADVNTIESISINGGSALTPDGNKNVNIEIPTISINGTEQTPSNHNIDIEVPIIKNGANNATIENDHSIIFKPIAFSGIMDDIDALGSSVVCFDCGNATDKLYQLTN